MTGPLRDVDVLIVGAAPPDSPPPRVSPLPESPASRSSTGNSRPGSAPALSPRRLRHLDDIRSPGPSTPASSSPPPYVPEPSSVPGSPPSTGRGRWPSTPLARRGRRLSARRPSCSPPVPVNDPRAARLGAGRPARRGVHHRRVAAGGAPVPAADRRPGGRGRCAGRLLRGGRHRTGRRSRSRRHGHRGRTVRRRRPYASTRPGSNTASHSLPTPPSAELLGHGRLSGVRVRHGDGRAHAATCLRHRRAHRRLRARPRTRQAGACSWTPVPEASAVDGTLRTSRPGVLLPRACRAPGRRAAGAAREGGQVAATVRELLEGPRSSHSR
ncbi:hypothetical protein ACRAWF_12280 [Streptomyces sp. L7]